MRKVVASRGREKNIGGLTFLRPLLRQANQKRDAARPLRRSTRRRRRRKPKQAAHVHVRPRKLATYQIPLARATLMREAPASLDAPFTAVLKDMLEEHVDFQQEMIALLISEAKMT